MHLASATRMEPALRPDLVWRIAMPGQAGDIAWAMGRDRSVLATAARAGASTPAGLPRGDARILDVFGSLANVTVVAREWADHLHVRKVAGRWVVTRVLWELTDEATGRELRRPDAQEDEP